MSRLNITRWKAALLGLLAVTATAWGAEGEAAEGPPDIFGGDFGSAIFVLLTFVTLLLILRKWAWEPLLTGLKKREDHIRRQVEQSEQARREAEDARLQYQQQLAQVQSEADKLLEKTRQEAGDMTRQLRAHAAREAELLREQAQRDIKAAKDRALQELYGQAGTIATELAGRIINRSLDPQGHRDLIQESIQQMKSDLSQN